MPTRESERAEAVLARARWRRLSWRDGTRGPLARFAAVRVRLADGVRGVDIRRLAGDAVWLVGEHRASGERKYYLANLPPAARPRELAAAVKARWSCEQAHQQLEEELGLDHFEGRTWRGLHHHALMTLIRFAFLQHLRLREIRGRWKNGAGPAAAGPHSPRCRPSGARCARASRPSPMPEMQRATGVSAARVAAAK